MPNLSLWLVVAAVFTAGLGYSHWTAYSLGREVEQKRFLEQINEDNENAGNEAEKWRAEYRRCVDAGGLYNFADGTCQR